MSTSTAYSSELYFIDPKDILSLQDATTVKDAPLAASEVGILIFPDKTDVLYYGRDIAEQATKDQIAYIPVRIWFQKQIPWWNILAIFIKPLRQKYKYNNICNYHTSLAKLRELKIERGFRTAENAYKISKKWKISEEERLSRYNELVASLEKGYKDEYPLQIMLCRRFGIKDCIDDGHHRIGVCVEKNIDRVTICFRAAGALPHWLRKLFAFLL